MAVIYQQLAPVLFGTDALSDMAKKISDGGLSRVFLICDQGIKMTGISAKVTDALCAQGIHVDVYAECIPDAPDTAVDSIAQRAQDCGAQLILGVGGGSPIDTAKAVGVAMDNNRPIATFMQENGNPGFEIKTPVYVLPTSSGTGSECTPMCVLHEMASDSKKVVLRTAQLAVLDPTLTLSCPAGVTVNAGLDALSHAVEAYTSVSPNPKDMILAIHAVKLIAENLPKCLEDLRNIEARSNLMFAANIAGIAFAEMSVHIGHCFAHTVGLKSRVNHGLCCGWSIPETIEFVADYKKKEICEIGEAMGIAIPEGADARTAVKTVAGGVRAFMRRCGMKSMKETGIHRSEAVAMAKEAVDDNWFHIMCPGGVTYEQMAAYIAACYDNYQ